MELVCKRCGVEGEPIIAPGKGPHRAAALCRACGIFIKWLPKERTDMPVLSLSRVQLLGVLGKHGVEVQFVGSNGTPKATFSLTLLSPGAEGKTFEMFVPCAVWGKKAEAAAEVVPGTPCWFEGQIRRRQTPEGKWDFVVEGYELTPVEQKS